MNRIFRYISLPVVAVALIALASACGPSAAERTARMESATATVDSLVHTSEAPFAVSKADYAEPNIDVTVVLADSMIKVDLLGEDLMDYYLAEQLKTSDQQALRSICSTLKDNEANVVLSLTDAFGASKTFIFSGEKLLNLAKAKRSQLNVPKVKDQVVALAGGAVPAPSAHAGAQVSTSIDKGFLTYTVTWPGKGVISGMPQGVLTGRYMQPLRDQYGRLGSLEYPVVEMLKTLGIDGVRIVYVATGTDDEVKQAFPWREIFK
ncbi:MAG: hypothetical protein Q4C34_06455 [Bacteroidales bacterium]|nr:hypothetical protein [Bacteroidales bacterium]